MMCEWSHKSTLKVMLFNFLIWSLGKKKKKRKNVKAIHEKEKNTSKAVLVKYKVKG